MATTTYSLRIDSELKSQAETIYGALGQTLSSAINAFLLQSVRSGGFPFEMRLSSNERDTVLALLEAEKIVNDPDVPGYDLEEALAELKR